VPPPTESLQQVILMPRKTSQSLSAKMEINLNEKRAPFIAEHQIEPSNIYGRPS